MQEQMKALQRGIGDRRRRLAEQVTRDDEVAALKEQLERLERENRAVLRHSQEQEKLIQELRCSSNQHQEAAQELAQAKSYANKYYMENQELMATVTVLQNQLQDFSASVGKRLDVAAADKQQLVDSAIERERHVKSLNQKVEELGKELEQSRIEASSLRMRADKETARIQYLTKMLLSEKFEMDVLKPDRPSLADELVKSAREGDMDRVVQLLHPTVKTPHSMGQLEAVLGRVLCHACQAGHLPVVEHLLSNFELDMNRLHELPGEGSGMALHFAIRANNEPIMRLLLPHTQQIDQHDGEDRTSLHLAVLHSGNPSHIRMLLRCGASPELCDSHSLTAQALANALEPPRVDLLEAFSHPGVMVWNYSRRAARLFEEQSFDQALRLFNKAVDCGTDALAEELSPTAIGLLFKNRAEVALKVDTAQHSLVVKSCSEALERLAQGTSEHRELLTMRATSALELCDFACAVEDFEQLTVLETNVEDMEQWCAKAHQAKALRDASAYDVLCVQETAEEGEIKKAFYKLSKQWHPDKHMCSEDAKIRSTRMFQRVADAYNVLSDSASRLEYDAEIAMKRCDLGSEFGDVSFSSDLGFSEPGLTPRDYDYEWYMSQMHQPYFESYFDLHAGAESDDY